LKNLQTTQDKVREKGAKAVISKNYWLYCATTSGWPEVELRFCSWLILFKYSIEQVGLT
jgi:hypothetical protein